MDEQSCELGLNNPRRRAQEERAKQAAREAACAAARGEVPGGAADAASGNAPARSSAPDVASTRGLADAADARGAAAGAPASSRTGRARTARPATRPASKKQSWWTRGRIAAVSVAALVAVLAVALAVGFAWLRWFSANDSTDIQGTWYLSGTATPILITEDRIQLTDDVSYRYTLNTADKTIQFTFGNLAGEGCYRFSLDRGQLALVDGAFTGSDTLSADIGWTIQALWENLQGNVLPPAEKVGKGVTLLSRTPAPGVAPPSSEGSDAAGAIQEGGGGEQVIEDDVVGDLSGKFPADMSDPNDKAADDAGSPADGAASQEGESAEGGASASGAASGVADGAGSAADNADGADSL